MEAGYTEFSKEIMREKIQNLLNNGNYQELASTILKSKDYKNQQVLSLRYRYKYNILIYEDQNKIDQTLVHETEGDLFDIAVQVGSKELLSALYKKGFYKASILNTLFYASIKDISQLNFLSLNVSFFEMLDIILHHTKHKHLPIILEIGSNLGSYFAVLHGLEHREHLPAQSVYKADKAKECLHLLEELQKRGSEITLPDSNIVNPQATRSSYCVIV